MVFIFSEDFFINIIDPKMVINNKFIFIDLIRNQLNV